jgi:hypothetical protein
MEAGLDVDGADAAETSSAADMTRPATRRAAIMAMTLRTTADSSAANHRRCAG